MAPACILMVIGVILVWSSEARPRYYEYSYEQAIDDAENDLKGTKSNKGQAHWNLNPNSRILGFQSVIPGKSEDRLKDSAPQTASSRSNVFPMSLQKPVLGRDRVLDQLHDHTGFKQPIHHSALDGWNFD